MSLVLTERLIQRQINHWNSMRAYLECDNVSGGCPAGPVITVSRLAGSGGRRLAETLAERLDLQLHDQSLVDRIARDRDLERAVVDQLDEKTVGRVRLWVQGLLQRRMFMADDYHTALVRVVMALAAGGGAVFLGRGANLILAHRADLRVRVVASDENRVRALRERHGLDREQAATALARTDAERARFLTRVFGVEPGLPRNFDLVLNADRLGTEAMADQVVLGLTGLGAGVRRAAATV